MKLKCSNCGKSVSTEVPDKTIIRAWIECPECLEMEKETKPKSIITKFLGAFPPIAFSGLFLFELIKRELPLLATLIVCALIWIFWTSGYIFHE